MTAAERTRNFGGLSLLVVAGGAFTLEPALRNSVFLATVLLLFIGGLFITGGTTRPSLEVLPHAPAERLRGQQAGVGALLAGMATATDQSPTPQDGYASGGVDLL